MKNKTAKYPAKSAVQSSLKSALQVEMTALKAQIKSTIATAELNKNQQENAEITEQKTQSVMQETMVDEKQLFMAAIGKVKPIINDTVRLNKSGHKSNTSLKNDQADNKGNRAIAQFHFSDEFEPDLNKQGPMKYVREGVDSFEAKNLRRGHYRPDLILDLHGLDQHQAKKELAALLFACQKEHAQCICVVHGIGSHILKNKVPHWLVQHPDVMAFHQAPLEWGGNGAILALIELKDKFS
ncbi:endonuclease SmrB [Colwellia echini]|uniref:Ribosome rescue factor SmrB n=1 Tax=Colwellia echini TaxID=1982103 RepID=A0ABY3MUS2_9GAMM|nr:endonuclease SmrB [Colwellia echini]TYK64939.1 endonuclease SmrB [Colwellia echini]